MHQPNIIEYWTSEAHQQGIEQGREQGEVRAKQADIFKLIRFRFQHLPKEVTDKITAIQDVSQLDTLFDAVLEAETLDEIHI